MQVRVGEVGVGFYPMFQPVLGEVVDVLWVELPQEGESLPNRPRSSPADSRVNVFRQVGPRT